MSGNIKNKSTKQLTLEEIIEKSSLRKNIESLSFNRQDISPDAKFSSNQFRSFSFYKDKIKIQQIPLPERMISKENILKDKKMQLIMKKTFTARTSKSIKDTLVYNHQFQPNKFVRTGIKEEQNTKQIKNPYQFPPSIQKMKVSSKNKSKNLPDYLCIKGSSGNKFNNQIDHQQCKNRNISEFETKNYQTLIEQGTERKKELSTQLMNRNQENQENKRFHSFMLTKYTTLNNFRQKSSKSIGKKDPQSPMFKINYIFPDQIFNSKNTQRAVKTEEKNRVKLSNNHEDVKRSKKILKKKQLCKNAQQKDSPMKQNLLLNNTILKSEDLIGKVNQQILIPNTEKTISSSKQLSKSNSKGQKTKGFRGTKIKSIYGGQKIKSINFIPDFLKPSLEQVMFDRKTIEVIRTQQNQSNSVQLVVNKDQLKKVKEQNQQIENICQLQSDEPLLLLINRLKSSKQLKEDQQISDLKEKDQKAQQDRDIQIKNDRKKNHQRNKINVKLIHEQDIHQICGWQDQNKTKKNRKTKNILNNFNTIGSLLDY